MIPGYKTNLVSQVLLAFQTVNAKAAQGVLEIVSRVESSAELCARNEFKEEPSFSSRSSNVKISLFVYLPSAQWFVIYSSRAFMALVGWCMR